MNNIRLEMNFYSVVKEYAVIVLFDDNEGVSSSINYYPKNKTEAKKQLTALENEYGVKGTING